MSLPAPVTIVRVAAVGSDPVGQVVATVAAAAPDMAARLHDGAAIRPYATERDDAWLRVIAFADDLTRALILGASALGRGPVVEARIPVATILAEPDGGATLPLTFRTPCHPRAAHRDYLFPDPERVFSSARARWETLGWPDLGPINLRRVAGEIVRYERAPWRAAGARRWGFLGAVRYDLVGLDPGQRAALWRLARFATLRGIGAHTGYGMGRVVIGER